MAKFFATLVFVINAEDDEEARKHADTVAASPDYPEFVETAWVDTTEEVEAVNDDPDEDPRDWDDHQNG